MLGITPQNQNNRLNLFYFSDYHGDIPAYRRLKSASDSFDSQNKQGATLKLSGGDLISGGDERKNLLVYRLAKKMKLDASAVGNHEWDNDADFYGEQEKLAKAAPTLLFSDFMSCNTKTPKDNEYKKDKLFQSEIITRNGQQYGVIGSTTFDYHFDKCKMDKLEETKKDISAEIANLKQQNPNLNKFILVSHLGIKTDREIAKSVPELDIIVGGHSHTQIDGVKPNENLFLTPKNEPVLIVQAGNEKNFGELTVNFDKDGKIDISQGNQPVNKLKTIFDFSESPDAVADENAILGKSQPLGFLTKAIPHDNYLIKENPIANLNADAVLAKTNADIALLDAGTFRSYANAGDISERNIEYLVPYSDEICTVKLKANKIADVLQLGINSTRQEAPKPGLYQVAGLTYAVSPDKKLKNLFIVDKKENSPIKVVDENGNLVKESANKEFTVAASKYLLKSGVKYGLLLDMGKMNNGKSELNDSKILAKFGKQRDILVDYLKTEFYEKNQPITPPEGRIIVERPDKPVDITKIAITKGSVSQ